MEIIGFLLFAVLLGLFYKISRISFYLSSIDKRLRRYELATYGKTEGDDEDGRNWHDSALDIELRERAISRHSPDPVPSSRG